jgi:hypothetical protein
MNMLYRASVTLGVPMKRVPIPPTRYDPMRPVQAKMAAPTGGPGVGIPPTRFGPAPIQARMGATLPPTQYASQDLARPHGAESAAPSVRVVQRAFAGGGGKGGGKHGSNAKYNVEKPKAAVPWRRRQQQRPSEVFAATVNDLESYLGSKIAVIGQDKNENGKDQIAPIVKQHKYGCLSLWLKDENVPYSIRSNISWIKKCILDRKVFYLASQWFVDEILSRRILPDQFLNYDDPGSFFAFSTTDEIKMLLRHGYVLHGKHLMPRDPKATAAAPANVVAVAPAGAAAAAAAANAPANAAAAAAAAALAAK